MPQYISKDALVAEIEKMIYEAYPNSEWNHGYVTSCEKILYFLNTLEVKGVDLQKEIGKYLDVNNIEYGFQVKLFDFARHFFELGIKATQKGE